MSASSQSVPIFDVSKRAHTSGWGNNCGFNCIVHFICDELEKPGNEAEIKKIYESPENRAMLDKFFDYYRLNETGIKKENFNILSLKKILQQYPHPLDREIILGPVLREYVGEKLKKEYDRGGRESGVAWDYFKRDALKYLKAKVAEAEGDQKAVSKAYADMDNVYMIRGMEDANAKMLDVVFKEYREACEKAREDKLEPPQLEDFFDDKRVSELWFTNNGVGNYLFEMTVGTAMISIPELVVATKSLGIELSVFDDKGPIFDRDGIRYSTTRSIYRPEIQSSRNLKIINIGKIHWEYEVGNLDSQKLAERNAQYPGDRNYDNPKKISIQRKFPLETGDPHAQTTVGANIRKVFHNILIQGSATDIAAPTSNTFSILQLLDIGRIPYQHETLENEIGEEVQETLPSEREHEEIRRSVKLLRLSKSILENGTKLGDFSQEEIEEREEQIEDYELSILNFSKKYPTSVAYEKYLDKCLEIDGKGVKFVNIVNYRVDEFLGAKTDRIRPDLEFFDKAFSAMENALKVHKMGTEVTASESAAVPKKGSKKPKIAVQFEDELAPGATPVAIPGSRKNLQPAEKPPVKEVFRIEQLKEISGKMLSEMDKEIKFIEEQLAKPMIPIDSTESAQVMEDKIRKMEEREGQISALEILRNNRPKTVEAKKKLDEAIARMLSEGKKTIFIEMQADDLMLARTFQTKHRLDRYHNEKVYSPLESVGGRINKWIEANSQASGREIVFLNRFSELALGALGPGPSSAQVVPTSEKTPISSGMYSMYSKHAQQSLENFHQNSGNTAIETTITDAKKITQSFVKLNERIEAAQSKPNDLFHGVECDKKHSTERHVILHVTTQGKTDTLTQEIDSNNHLTAKIKGNAQDRSYLVFALANKHFTPPALDLQPHKDPAKILKAMEAFMHAGVPLDIGEENRKLFSALQKSQTLTPIQLEQVELFKILTTGDGEAYKTKLAGLTDEERNNRKFGDPFKKSEGPGVTLERPSPSGSGTRLG